MAAPREAPPSTSREVFSSPGFCSSGQPPPLPPFVASLGIRGCFVYSCLENVFITIDMAIFSKEGLNSYTDETEWGPSMC
ncbi:unnamed protein product [Nesidiocoris tenuis]|uniref:Uncharacterized protein n=1 Tax=Nesidiocoris tenuis TaxID=355587 RepID=A0A6H5HKS7_9HEMI|nr:unnamed protein product [Nesidiocoris tenuis]